MFGIPQELLCPETVQALEFQTVRESDDAFMYQVADTLTPHPEQAYLDLLGDILTNGETRQDRTGTGTLSVFARQVRFDISKHIPVLTTKKVVYNKVIEELLWFMRGDTDASHLREKGVHIWDGNSTREFLDSRGLCLLPEYDIGAGYGFQWRHFGGKYINCKTPPLLTGFDQLEYVLSELRNNPTSRRIFMSAWNPDAMNEMALPPCHVSAQFYVSFDEKTGTKHLSCHMYQRSVDAFLGFPWNILSYSVLTYILAAMTGMQPKELVISTGDTHIYKDHIEQVKTQLARAPLPLPKLILSDRLSDPTTKIEEITLDDFKIIGYYAHPSIAAKMSV